MLGAVGDFAALGFGAQSIVAPLGSFNLVWNVIVTPIFLKEKVTRLDLIATATIVSGCVVAVAFASHKNCLYTLSDLFELYRRPQFYVYAVAVTLILVVWLLWIRWVERVQARFGSNSPEYQRYVRFHRVSYAAVSGIAGAQSVLFAKTCVELVTDAFAHNGKLFLTYGPFYGVLFAMGATITLQIYWLNCGLARWDIMYNGACRLLSLSCPSPSASRPRSLALVLVAFFFSPSSLHSRPIRFLIPSLSPPSMLFSPSPSLSLSLSPQSLCSRACGRSGP